VRRLESRRAAMLSFLNVASIASRRGVDPYRTVRGRIEGGGRVYSAGPEVVQEVAWVAVTTQNEEIPVPHGYPILTTK